MSAPVELVASGPCRCGVMVAECLVPVGDEAVPACWVCAHDYVTHGREIGLTSGLPCECRREDIYPADVIERRDRASLVSVA